MRLTWKWCGEGKVERVPEFKYVWDLPRRTLGRIRIRTRGDAIITNALKIDTHLNKVFMLLSSRLVRSAVMRQTEQIEVIVNEKTPLNWLISVLQRFRHVEVHGKWTRTDHSLMAEFGDSNQLLKAHENSWHNYLAIRYHRSFVSRNERRSA